MKKISNRIKVFLQYFTTSHFKTNHIEDLPEKFEDKVIYIVGDENYIWCLAFKCPCGCDEIVYLNTLKTTKPSWRYKLLVGKITISPSIHRNVGCRSHFIVKKGKVIWVLTEKSMY